MRDRHLPDLPAGRRHPAQWLVGLAILALTAPARAEPQPAPLPPPLPPLPAEVPAPPMPPEVPALTTAPDGVFNRVRALLLEHREVVRRLRQQIEAESQWLREMRQPGRSPARDLPEVRDRLGHLHEWVAQLVDQQEQARQLIRTDVLPNLGAMASEVSRELQVVPPGDPRRAPLEAVAQRLELWRADPERALEMLEGERELGPAALAGPVAESGGFFARRLARRLERMEAQQRRLSAEVERLGEEIERLRAVLDAMPPEMVERVEQSLPPERPEADWRSWHRREHPEEPDAPDRP